LGCESVSDLIVEVKRLREELNEDEDENNLTLYDLEKDQLISIIEGLEDRDEYIKGCLDNFAEYEKYSICHPDGTHCCDECLERNGFEVKK